MTTTPSTGTSGAKQQAQETASTAADEGKHVAGVAAEQAKDVAGEAKEHARNLVGEAQGQLGEQTRTQRDRLVGTLQSFGDDLQQMASSSSGLAGDVARQVADRARTLSNHLDGREPQDILDDVRRFARQRPGTFLLGALAAGVVAGRLARGAKDASSGSGSSGGYLDTSTTRPSSGPGLVETDVPGTATGSPLAGVTGDVSADDPTRAPGTGIADPLSAADPALGAQVPPSATGRYEP